MVFDPKIYHNSKDGIGDPGDVRAASAEEASTLVSLSKALLYAFSVTGISVTFGAANKGFGTAANALRTVIASDSPDLAALTSIDGHVDGLEALVGATNTALSTIDGHVDGLETLITSSNTKLDTVHTDAAAILAKLIAAPATEAKQDTGNTSLGSIVSLLTTQAGYLDGLEGLIGTTNAKDFATQTTLAAVLAKLNGSVAVTGTFWQTTQPVSIASMPSTPVTGTFWQATQPISGTVAATQSGTWNVTINTALPAGSNIIGALTANQSVNAAQINGVTPLMGNGVTGTGSQRVTIASDNTAFSVNAVQSGAWTVTANAGSGTMAVSLASVPSHAVTNAGTFAVQSSVADGANVAEGAVADAVVAAGAAGSISAKLRAISRDIVANIVLAAGSNLIGRTVADASAATGGIASTARLASAAASTNATNVKASAGRVYSVCGKNNAAYDVFLVLYDSATNPPVPGTTTIRKKVPCPSGQAFVYDFDLGLSFASGIGYAFTKLVADADTTVLVAADITAFNLDYV